MTLTPFNMLSFGSICLYRDSNSFADISTIPELLFPLKHIETNASFGFKRSSLIRTSFICPDVSNRTSPSGQIKEVLINEALLKPKEALVSICFRGKSSSGIVEISAKEFESLYKQIEPKLSMLKGVKVMRFGK